MRVKESVVRRVVTTIDGVEQDAEQLATLEYIEQSCEAEQSEIGMAVAIAISRGWLKTGRSVINDKKFYAVSEAGKRVMNGW